MTVKEFFQENGFQSKPDIRVSNTQCYQGTDESVQYIRLPKAVQGFNFMIISRNALKQCKEDPKALKDLETSYDETYGWHAQVQDSSAKSDLNFEW